MGKYEEIMQENRGNAGKCGPHNSAGVEQYIVMNRNSLFWKKHNEIIQLRIKKMVECFIGALKTLPGEKYSTFFSEHCQQHPWK